MNHVDLVGKAREECCLLHCGVATAHNRDGLLPKEETVAGGAPRNPVSAEAVFMLDAEFAIRGARRHDNGQCFVRFSRTQRDALNVSRQV